MMMRRTIIALLFLNTSLFGQAGSTVFSANALYRTARTMLGDSTAWPIITALARHDVETNTFVISKEASKQIKNFSTLYAKVVAGKEYMTLLLKAGARVFAPNELESAITFSGQFDRAIQLGSMNDASRAGTLYLNSLTKIEKDIRSKRNEDIDAMVAQKSGNVDKRKGFLGAWNEATQGDMLSRSDGVRTGNASFAQLAFTDGCEVIVDPNSTVVIRESKMDKLDQSVQRNIALVKGSLLTKMTESAKERNNFTFAAGSSESQVKSGKFWASAIEERRVKLSNYDGKMNVAASKRTVTLKQNQGTVVEAGKAPLPPVSLLPAPQLLWTGIDSVVYDDNFQLRWTPIEKSTGYKVELCREKEFNTTIKIFNSSSPQFALTAIDLGITYVRLVAIDNLGLRGIESPVYRIIRVEDKLPPPIHIDGWETDRRYTALSSVTITGSTEPDALFSVNGVSVELKINGTFSFPAAIGSLETQLRLKASDRSGNTRERILSIVPIDSSKLKNIEWNGEFNNGILRPSTGEISARGTAYPSMRITAVMGTERVVVQTDSQGSWAVALKKTTANSITIIFESLTDSMTVLTVQYQVQ